MAEYAALGKKIEERYNALKGARQPWETQWQEISRYFIPQRTPGLCGTVMTPNASMGAELFDTTGIHACMTLANGQLAWMSPMEAAWFAFEAQGEQADDSKNWLAKATKVAQAELAVSNFYTAIHEAYLDRAAFGTCCLYVEPGKRRSINAEHWPVGTFVIEEDAEGIIDTVIREFTLTARQAVQKFGDGVSAKVKKDADDPKKACDKISFRHAIYPREDLERDKEKMDAPNMAIASVYVEMDGCHVCQQGGYEEMPVMVSRYLEWGSAVKGLYGYSPALMALADARQVNFLEKMGDALAEKAAFPPVLAPDELEGEIDPNAHGVTYFSKDLIAGGMPKEWMTQGRYDILTDRVKRREEAINRQFHVDLFQMFSQIEKQMTAREVSERASEKLIQFSPTFARLTTEMFNPLLERVFGILLRSGRLGAVDQIPQGLPYTVQYSSRIALALRAQPSLGYGRTLERQVMLAPVVPSVLDNIDFDKAERATALFDGMNPDHLRPQKEMDDMRKQRAAAEEVARKQEQAAMAAKAASDVGRIPPESPVGKVIQSNLGQAA